MGNCSPLVDGSHYSHHPPNLSNKNYKNCCSIIRQSLGTVAAAGVPAGEINEINHVHPNFLRGRPVHNPVDYVDNSTGTRRNNNRDARDGHTRILPRRARRTRRTRRAHTCTRTRRTHAHARARGSNTPPIGPTARDPPQRSITHLP